MKILSQNLGNGRVESRLAVLLTAVFSVSLVFNIKPLSKNGEQRTENEKFSP